MKITIKLSHSKKSKQHHVTPFTFHFDKESGTGPVLLRGSSISETHDLQEGDVIEFSTTNFTDEFDVKMWRGKKLLNAVGGDYKKWDAGNGRKSIEYKEKTRRK